MVNTLYQYTGDIKKFFKVVSIMLLLNNLSKELSECNHTLYCILQDNNYFYGGTLKDLLLPVNYD